MHKDRMLKIDRTIGENGEILQMIAIGIPPTRNEYFRWRERKIEGEIEEFDRAAKEETRNAGATSRGRFHALYLGFGGRIFDAGRGFCEWM